MRKNWPEITSAFAIGLGVGAIVGMMWAPQSGEETRALLREKAQDGIDEAVAQGRRVARKAQKATDSAKELVNDAVDAGQNLSEAVVQYGGKLKFWWPTHIEEDKWPLFHSDHPRFGLGTTYDDCIYHAFYSRNNLSDRFLEKCKTVLMVNG